MKSSRLAFAFLASTATALATGTFDVAAHGAIISGNSDGYGANVSASVVGSLVTLSVPTLGLSQGAAPAAYSSSQTAIAINASAGLNVGLASATIAAINGTASSTAISTIDGTLGAKVTSGTAEVDNLGVTLGSETLIGISLATALNMTGGVITSSASISSDSPLSIAGDSTLIGLVLKVGTVSIPLSGYVDANGKAAPNTTLSASVLGIAGLTVILNEQIPSVNGIAVNAIHIKANAISTGAPDLGLLTADVIVAHSQAYETAVPEPATAGLLISGTLPLLIRRRKCAH